MTIQGLISRTHLASFVTTLSKQLKYSTFVKCFLSIIISNRDGALEILITLFFPHSCFLSWSKLCHVSKLEISTLIHNATSSLPSTTWRQSIRPMFSGSFNLLKMQNNFWIFQKTTFKSWFLFYDNAQNCRWLQKVQKYLSPPHLA